MKIRTYTSLSVLIVFSFIFCDVKAQKIDVGTKWTYNQNSGFSFPPPPPEDLIRTIEIVSDTLVNNQRYLKLEGSCAGAFGDFLYRVEGFKHYIFRDGEEFLLYDFGIGPGELIAIAAPMLEQQDSVKLMVIDLEVQEHNGEQFLIQVMDPYFTDGNFFADWGPRFMEHVGSLDFCLFPQGGLFEGNTGSLRCIEFADGTSIKFTEDVFCNIVATSDPELSYAKVYPNPVAQMLHIESEENIRTLVLHNVEGVKIFENMDTNKISMNHFPKGIYVLEISYRNGKSERTKITKL